METDAEFVNASIDADHKRDDWTTCTETAVTALSLATKGKRVEEITQSLPEGKHLVQSPGKY